MTETVVFMQFNLLLCCFIRFYAVLFDFTLLYLLFIGFYQHLPAFHAYCFSNEMKRVP